MRDQGSKWLRKAEEHLGMAQLALKEGFYAMSSFHSQQAAEFSLKGLLISTSGVHLLTHSLVRLAAEAKEFCEIDLPEVRDLRELEDHYVQARYPNARVSEYVSGEAERALKTARRVVDGCRKVSQEKS